MDIRIQGASEHNLKRINARIGNGLTVVTGVSGSGKTSLVFDTVYHEAHRRFLDVFLYGRRGQRLAPARVESISGLLSEIETWMADHNFDSISDYRGILSFENAGNPDHYLRAQFIEKIRGYE